MKTKMAIANNVATIAEVNEGQKWLSENLVPSITAHFPDWQGKSVHSGEIFLQDPDFCTPLGKNVRPGVSLVVSLVSQREGRNFEGLAKKLAEGLSAILNVPVFAQISIDNGQLVEYNTAGQNA